jgi:hypothetical protein
MQLDGHGLPTVCGAGIIGGLVGCGRGLFGGCGSTVRRGRRRVARAFDQTSEVGRRRYRNEVVAGGKARDTVFAKIVSALGSNLLPVAASRDKGLAHYRDLSLGQGIAVFVGDAAFHHRCGLQTNDEIFEFLACGQREHAAFAAAAVLVDFLEAGAFHKQPIATGQDVLDAKAAVHAGEGRVVSAIALALGDQFDERFLQGLAAGIFGDHACDDGSCRLRSFRLCLGKERNGSQQDG